MLVLTREVGQAIRIGDDIEVTVVKIGQGRVRIGVSAPGETPILRGELLERLASPGGDVSPERPRRDDSRRVIENQTQA